LLRWSNSYIQIARLLAAKNEFKVATAAAEKGLDIYQTCLGAESEKTKEAEKSVRAFRKQIPTGKASVA
jgi:hypothetical protein